VVAVSRSSADSPLRSHANRRPRLGSPVLFSGWSGSVSGVLSLDDHLSRTTVADGLKRAYPSVGRASLSRSYLPLLQVGFAKPPRYRDAGALLPHRFSFSPARRGKAGESSFLWHFPSARAAQALAGTLPCGAPTFLTPPKRTRGRLAHSSCHSSSRESQAPLWRPCACSLAHVSLSVSVRLNTGAPGAESLSGQK
jgi:hypothetical protein